MAAAGALSMASSNMSKNNAMERTGCWGKVLGPLLEGVIVGEEELHPADQAGRAMERGSWGWAGLQQGSPAKQKQNKKNNE